MKTIVYISDFRLPTGLNFVKPLQKLADHKKILIIERHNLHHDEVLRDFFDEIRYVDHLESVDAIREHHDPNPRIPFHLCFVNAG